MIRMVNYLHNVFHTKKREDAFDIAYTKTLKTLQEIIESEVEISIKLAEYKNTYCTKN